jgi:hypothetical protein
VAINGVPFDPGTAEFWKRDRNSGWVEEGIVNGKKLLGIDINNAHVQPDGTYHYHGIPKALVVEDFTHVGYAADGHKVYASKTGEYKSSYQLKKGKRPDGGKTPEGNYDGTYTQDYTYVAGSGDLDACNGMMHEGKYIYVATEGFPFIPRCWMAKPDKTFEKKSPQNRGSRPGGKPFSTMEKGHRPPRHFMH